MEAYSIRIRTNQWFAELKDWTLALSITMIWIHGENKTITENLGSLLNYNNESFHAYTARGGNLEICATVEI